MAKQSMYYHFKNNTMKRIYLLVLASFIAVTSIAQRHQPVNPQKDKQNIEGFTVRLKEAPGNTYLFDIEKEGKPVAIQLHNPFTMAQQGFQKKEDSYKVAKWLLREYKLTGHFPLMIPPHVAHELNISRYNAPNNRSNH
jgi:hypothetical protein